jgi:hypothetical protein
VAAWVLYALDTLAHRPFGGRVFALTFLAWVGWAPVGVWLRPRLSRWQLWLAHVAGPGLLLGVLHPFLPGGLTAGEAAFVLIAVASLALGLGVWLDRAHREGARTAGECVRLLLVLGVGAGAMAGFMTDRLIGGVDARWYAQMLADFVQQMRSGVFPVLVGQGEFAYNGAVHPFRSAPLLFQVSGILDLLTVRVLTPVALQHLSLVGFALLGAGGMYGLLVALASGRRWWRRSTFPARFSWPASTGWRSS